MHFATLLLSLLIALVSATVTTVRTSKPNCTALIEDSPWVITKFTHFQVSRPNNHCRSHVMFHWMDTNKGLEKSTACVRYAPFMSNQTVAEAEWFGCESREVKFMFTGAGLQVSRWYEDDCLGDYPYNSAIAYGRVDLNLTMTKTRDGVFRTKTEMHMPISSLS